MSIESILAKARTLGGQLQRETIDLLGSVNESITQELYQFLERYYSRGINLYPHLNFLIEIHQKQIRLRPSIQSEIRHFLAQNPVNYADIIRQLYREKWSHLLVQANRYNLAYHHVYHAMEVASRTIHLAKTLDLFADEDEVSHFLHFLLLVAAKYHDYIQRYPGEPNSALFHTVEEETAVHVFQWIMEELRLTEDSVMTDWIELFFKETIGLGTTLLIGKNESINLSTIFTEMQTILQQPPHESNRKILQSLQCMCEILNIVDKAAPTCLAIIEHQKSDYDTQITLKVQEYLGRPLRLLRFLSEQEVYYPEQSLEVNFETFCLFQISHVEMQLELNRTSAKKSLAESLTKIIKKGQALYRNGEERALKEYLAQLLTDDYQHLFEQLFIQNIAGEIWFALRLAPICQQAIDTFAHLGYSDIRHSFTNPSVPLVEAQILEHLKCFYLNSSLEVKNEMMQEMIAISIFQPGIVYVKNPGMISEIEPTEEINCKTPDLMRRNSKSLSFSESHSFIGSWSPRESRSVPKTPANTPYGSSYNTPRMHYGSDDEN